MAANANVFVKQPGNVEGSSEDAELPEAVAAALADRQPTALVIEAPPASGKKYVLQQVA